MAISTSLLASLITVLLFISMFQAHEMVNNVNGKGRDLLILDTKIDCGKECIRRCQLSSRKKVCHRACGTCCARCNCVPPGTSGNRDVCPCYANMTTHRAQLKCP